MENSLEFQWKNSGQKKKKKKKTVKAKRSRVKSPKTNNRTIAGLTVEVGNTTPKKKVNTSNKKKSGPVIGIDHRNSIPCANYDEKNSICTCLSGGCYLRNCIYVDRNECKFFKKKDIVMPLEVKTPVVKREILDWTERDIRYVTICHGPSRCYKEKHPRKDYDANVKSMRTNEIYKLKVFYCEKCKKFYILADHLPEKEVLNHIPHILFRDNTISRMDFGADKSILAKYGYSAGKNGPIKPRRQKILYELIVDNVVTCYDIIEHLNYLISLHESQESWQEAISIYEEDIAYVRRLQSEIYNGTLLLKNRRL